MLKQNLELAIQAAKTAGTVILHHYNKNTNVVYKGDGSPLTAADQAAHKIIEKCLKQSGEIVVSEEGADLCLGAQRYWLVDPLDGTKDFLAGNNEFTVNIALVESGYPLIGVVYGPAADDMFWGIVGQGAERMRQGAVCAMVTKARSAECRIAVSRFHDHPAVDVFATENGINKRVAIGSALKYGLLAASEVDVFPRLVGSSEWDTAAGQAILESVGGQVVDWHTGQRLAYGKPKRRNPRLLAMRSPYRHDEFKIEIFKEEIL